MYIYITYPERTDTSSLWGPVVTSARVPNWVGAFAATSNTGELSGMYHALDWINTRRQSSAGVRPRYNIVSDSDYCVKLFATRSIKPVANKRMIARIYALLARIKETNDVSISWTRLTRRRTLPSREEMRHWIYLLREDAQPLVYPAPLALARPPHRWDKNPPTIAVYLYPGYTPSMAGLYPVL